MTCLAHPFTNTDLPGLFQLPAPGGGNLAGRRIVVAMSGGVDSSRRAAPRRSA